MIDQKKIILMSKVALEEKKFTRKDRDITSYYPEDYVYVNNFKTRLIVLIVIGGLIGLQFMFKVNEGINVPTTINEWIEIYIIPYGLVILIPLILYSFISTIVYKNKYKRAEKRKQSYDNAVIELKEYKI